MENDENRFDLMPESDKSEIDGQPETDNELDKEQNQEIIPIFQAIEPLQKKLSSIIVPHEGLNLSSIVAPFEGMNLSSMIAPLDGIKQLVQKLSVGFDFQSSLIFENIRLINESTKQITDSLTNLSNICASFVKSIQAPSLVFLENFDTSYFHELLKKIAIGKDLSHNYRDMLLQTMYEVKWFPSVVFPINFSVLIEINEIIHTSRGASKSREKRIDKVMLSYYSKTVIREIKKRWWNSDLDFCVRKMLGQSIEAYFRGEYALTICCLATMWEGLLKNKIPPKKTENKNREKDDRKKDVNDLVVENGYKAILADFYNTLIIGTCYGVDEVVDGIPNRNGIAHGWYNKYPNKKTALNAILLTDFIISLKPMEKTEENENG